MESKAQVHPSPYVSQQPQAYYSQNVAIISTQPVQFGKREWSVGYCNCCSDFGECCFAYFCPVIYQCKLFSQAGEPCCSCIYGGLVPLRTKIRTQRNIKGSICGDFYAVSCCPFCAMLQMGNEMRETQPLIN